jgi:hypothetical protein
MPQCKILIEQYHKDHIGISKHSMLPGDETWSNIQREIYSSSNYRHTDPH